MEWTLLSEPPDNAVALSEIAETDDRVGDRLSYWRSMWFSGPNGEIMLCRVGAGFVMSRTWVFDPDGRLTNDGVIVLRGS